MPIGAKRLVLFATLALGCRAHGGTTAQEMGAAEHERAAQREEHLAREMTELTAAPHRELAARHRAASEALLDAEARACVDIAEADRATGPFEHPRDVVGVDVLEDTTWTGSSATDPRTRIAGAEIRLRAAPGMTVEWLQRLVDCHIARNAAIGHERAGRELPTCPLTLAGVHAQVRSSADGFTVAVTSDDDAVAREVVRRARALRG